MSLMNYSNFILYDYKYIVFLLPPNTAIYLFIFYFKFMTSFQNFTKENKVNELQEKYFRILFLKGISENN